MGYTTVVMMAMMNVITAFAVFRQRGRRTKKGNRSGQTKATFSLEHILRLKDVPERVVMTSQTAAISAHLGEGMTMIAPSPDLKEQYCPYVQFVR
jgi:hypothetical protein